MGPKNSGLEAGARKRVGGQRAAAKTSKAAAAKARKGKTPIEKTNLSATSAKKKVAHRVLKTSSPAKSGRVGAVPILHSPKKLDKALLLRLHDLMVKSRVLEERLIKIYRTGDAYFWIGGTGEEAFGVPLGLLANKGHGPEHDYLHLHYRCTSTLVAMGMAMVDSIRLIMNRATDRSTGGRNFSNHYCFPEWNVLPVTSPIEVQYLFAIGTARVQKRRQTNGVTVVSGGDAGTAEGDFASCLVWASRPGNELPLLITVQNNQWGISTSYDTQHGEMSIADRGKAFGIRTRVFDGNDPIESYFCLQEEYDYVRRQRKPSLIEAKVSRLNGHSSASGANRVETEVDCLLAFESQLFKDGLLSEVEAREIRDNYEREARDVTELVRTEPVPEGTTIWDHVFVDNENADWRDF